MENPFKWRHYEGEIIRLAVRRYLRYALSYRDLAEILSERGLGLAQTTIYRNNRIEQDHHFIKQWVKLGLSFFSYLRAWRTLGSYEHDQERTN
jgi:transposase-like protein